MNLLVIGGAGYVGTLLRPALEERHVCRYLDLRAVEGAEDRSIVGSVNDSEVVGRAVEGQDGVLFLAMGVRPGIKDFVNDLDMAFDVNVRGFYRVLTAALAGGAKQICLASTMSVYKHHGFEPIQELVPANTWQPYGLSKRVAEFLCDAAAQEYPEATLVALRLILPRNEADFPEHKYDPGKARNINAIGPKDMRRLVLAALDCTTKGSHIVQTSGDMSNQAVPNDRVHALLGWLPRNE